MSEDAEFVTQQITKMVSHFIHEIVMRQKTRLDELELEHLDIFLTVDLSYKGSNRIYEEYQRAVLQKQDNGVWNIDIKKR